jgi:hypothetical protein
VRIQVAVSDAVQAGRDLLQPALPLVAQVGHALLRKVSRQQVEAWKGLQAWPAAE